MLTIEEYIAKRKKEDKLYEFDIESRTHNMKLCVDYVFEYFNNYVNITEDEEKTILHSEKLDRYRKQLMDYEPEVREWVISIYSEYRKQIHKHVRSIVNDIDLFYLYNTESEFRNVSYQCYPQLIKKLPFLKAHTEMLFLFLKEYHRVESQQVFSWRIPTINDKITDWVDQTWSKYRVNILAFAYHWANGFFDNDSIWPSSHKIKSSHSWRKYDYDYKQKSNLFNIDSLYKKMPKKPFVKGKKQELEILFMYYWIHDFSGDQEYWQEYLEKVLPSLSKE
ncbi:MAG: hypothetical protein FIA99_05500 [Ruminiclostridium sp.]|nr:hypothetical protein [Ruminiclostridium sp.]